MHYNLGINDVSYLGAIQEVMKGSQTLKVASVGNKEMFEWPVGTIVVILYDPSFNSDLQV